MSQEKDLRIQLYISLGMSGKEAEIYDLLLQRGEMAARDVEMETKFKKNTYVLVKSLERKGLLMRVEREKRVYYQPASPQNLGHMAAKQIRSAQRHAGMLAEILPDLTAKYSASVERPVVRYVEGVEGLKELYHSVYNQDISASYGCLDLEREEKAVPELMGEHLIPNRVKRGSRAFAVLSDNVSAQDVSSRDLEELRESILVDPKEYPLPAEVSVYGDKVALLSFKKGNMTGVLIENKEIAKSLESVYKLLFRFWRESRRVSEKIDK